MINLDMTIRELLTKSEIGRQELPALEATNARFEVDGINSVWTIDVTRLDPHYTCDAMEGEIFIKIKMPRKKRSKKK